MEPTGLVHAMTGRSAVIELRTTGATLNSHALGVGLEKELLATKSINDPLNSCTEHNIAETNKSMR